MSHPTQRRTSTHAAAHPTSGRLGHKYVGGPHLRLLAEHSEAEVQRRVGDLLAKIQNHTAVVGIVGMGYVGLPFAVEKGKVGFKVVGIEHRVEIGADDGIHCEILSGLAEGDKVVIDTGVTDWAKVAVMEHD